MPNLVKSNLVICEEDKRVINSNELIAEKIKNLWNVSEYVQGEAYDDEFSELIQTDRVKLLLEDNQEVTSSEWKGSDLVLEQAKAEADAIREQAKQEVQEMMEQGFRQGEERGRQEGYTKGMSEASAVKQQLDEERQELEKAYQKQLHEMEPMLVNVLTEIFESAFSIQFADKKDFILHILHSSFNKIENSKEYVIRVSKEDFPLLQEKKEELRRELPHNASIEIVEDMTLLKNQCLIETDGGVFDCGFDTQMNNLIRDIKMLSCN